MGGGGGGGGGGGINDWLLLTGDLNMCYVETENQHYVLVGGPGNALGPRVSSSVGLQPSVC